MNFLNAVLFLTPNILTHLTFTVVMLIVKMLHYIYLEKHNNK